MASQSDIWTATTPYHAIIELSTYAFFLLMVFHAVWLTDGIKKRDEKTTVLRDCDRLNRWRWLSTLLLGVVFGVVLEWSLVERAEPKYSYGEFWVMLPNLLPDGQGEVPLWVGLGWAVITYAAMWTAQRLHLNQPARALFAALLAVNIDLSLDPVVQALGFWKWDAVYPHTYYQIPFDNFICWLVIVSSFTFSVQRLFRWSWLAALPGSTVWIPAVGTGLSLWFISQFDPFLNSKVYPLFRGDLPVFAVVFIAAIVCVVWQAKHRSRRRLPVSWPILAVPIYYHSLMLAFLFHSGKWNDPALSSLIAVIPVNLALGVLAFGWSPRPSLSTDAGAEPTNGPKTGSPVPVVMNIPARSAAGAPELTE